MLGFPLPLIEQSAIAELLHIALAIRRIVRSVTPAISAASNQLIFLAIAFKITSCNFIIRSMLRRLSILGLSNSSIAAAWLSGQITYSFDRTNHILTTLTHHPHCLPHSQVICFQPPNPVLKGVVLCDSRNATHPIGRCPAPVGGINMRIQAIRFLSSSRRPPAVAVAGTVTLLLIVATIVVAVLGMLPR